MKPEIFSRNIQLSVILLVLFLLGLLLGMIAVSTKRDYELALTSIQNAATEKSTIAQLFIERELAHAQNISSLLTQHQTDITEQTLCNTVLPQIPKTYSIFRSAELINLNGQSICPTNNPVLISSIDRSFLNRARSTRSATFSVGLLNAIPPLPTLLIGSPISSPSAQTPYILLTTLNINPILNTIVSSKHQDITVSIFDPSGTILYRYPDKSLIGEQVTDDFFEATKSSSNAEPEIRRGVDGVNRVIAVQPFTAGPDTNLTVAVGISESEIRLAFIKQFGTFGALLISVYALIVFIVWKLVGGVILQQTKQFAKFDTMKSDFISLAAHQLRTPMTAIRWNLELILSGDLGDVPEKQKPVLDKIMISINRLNEIIRHLLNISRIESNRIIIQSEELRINDFVETVLSELKSQFDEKHQHIQFQAGNNLQSLITDKTMLREVIMNILTNASKYTPSEKTITITTSGTASQIEIAIRDEGHGIPKEDQKHIFQKFYRASNIRTKDTRGSGLGLYLAKLIVDRFGGTISFTSEENIGTTFYIQLPTKPTKNNKGVVALTPSPAKVDPS